MTEQSFTPSWIKIDDDKFRDLLEYLCRKARSDGHDPFYSAAQELLKGGCPRWCLNLHAEWMVVRRNNCSGYVF